MNERVIEFTREKTVTERVEMNVDQFVEYCSEFRWYQENGEDVIDVYVPDLVNTGMMTRAMTIRGVQKNEENEYLTPDMVKTYILEKDSKCD